MAKKNEAKQVYRKACSQLSECRRGKYQEKGICSDKECKGYLFEDSAGKVYPRNLVRKV